MLESNQAKLHHWLSSVARVHSLPYFSKDKVEQELQHTGQESHNSSEALLSGGTN